jgi:hypothetical protein
VAEFRDHTLQDDEIVCFFNTIVCCTIKTVGSHLKLLLSSYIHINFLIYCLAGLNSINPRRDYLTCQFI